MNTCSNYFPYVYLHAWLFASSCTTCLWQSPSFPRHKWSHHRPYSKRPTALGSSLEPLALKIRCPAAAWPSRRSDILPETTAQIHRCCAMPFNRCYSFFQGLFPSSLLLQNVLALQNTIFALKVHGQCSNWRKNLFKHRGPNSGIQISSWTTKLLLTDSLSPPSFLTKKPGTLSDFWMGLEDQESSP